MAKGYAFFDLDHTLLPHDTQALFCNFVLRREGCRRIWLLWFLPLVPFAAIGLISLRTMKRLFLGYLWGMRKETFEQHIADFLDGDFKSSVYPQLIAEIERHRTEGRILVLNSASPDVYLQGIAEQLGFDHVFGTRLELPERLPWLPVIVGPNNKHGEKIERMKAAGLIPQEAEQIPDSWSYSDSLADLPLLNLAEHGVLVHPGASLAAIGLAKEWRILTPERPYAGKWSGRFASCLLALGLFRPRSARP